MSAGADKAVLRAKVLAALEQAAREEAKAFDQNRFCICDRSSTGALVPRISFISGLSGAVVLRHLRAARDADQVIERAPSYKGGMSRWWPVGLWDKLQAERAASPQFTITGVDLYDAKGNKFASLTPADLEGGAS